MSLPAEEIETPLETHQVRSSSRERSLTAKGQELHEQEAKKNEKAFSKVYDSWRHTAKEIRMRLKSFCSSEDLDVIKSNIKSKHTVVLQHYEPIQRNHTTTPDIAKRMDACAVLTTEICELVSKCLESVNETFKDHLEKERVRMVLNKNEYGSIFGNTITETLPSLQGSDADSSTHSRAPSKRADAEAELAANLERAKVMEELHAQQAKLDKLENEWKIKEAQMLAEIKQREAEMKQRLEEEKSKLQQLQADNEVKVAAARVQAYNSFDSFAQCEEESQFKSLYGRHNTDLKTSLDPEAASFQPHLKPPEPTTTKEEVSLAQVIASTLTLNRLPVPEPTVFSGDPLKFIDWKISFMALVGQRPLPESEKMLYLKNYLAGEAGKAIECFFFRNAEDAYQGAWAVLQDRYGSPFIVQRSFRERLAKWPKIAANDPIALREFADFLQGCVEAIPHIKGLAILNDCEENHKLLKKLPDWIVRRWSRIVVGELDESGDYPSFACFTEFMQREARIACNPIASPLLMNIKATDERLPKRVKVLNTSIQSKKSFSRSLDSTKSCLVCLA